MDLIINLQYSPQLVEFLKVEEFQLLHYILLSVF